jgi:peptidoglycan/LPS O-acetylase OafA/YrhL
LKYRSEIDGLRALAVVSVILFHAGFAIFSGGFVGVDVFFVISGYLITTILIEDIDNKRFSFLDFYERRARRILPALFFVMLCSILFSWMWMLPSQLDDFSHSLVAVSLFSSNVLFWQESGYFDAAAEEKPLLHTWSLAVEEQYYVLFPIFLFLAWRYGKNRVFWMIVLFSAISFLLSEWGWRNKSTPNFYLAPTRAWELLAGTMAAFVVQRRGVVKNDSLALVGLAAILVSVFVYDEATPFPSAYALAPVLGAVLLVLFADKETFAARLLNTRLLVGIGFISYSAYLWHQPLFAFARIQSLSEPSPMLMLFLSCFSVALAVVSWKIIEQPFRRKEKIDSRRLFFFSSAGLVMFVSIGLYGHDENGYINGDFIMSPNVEFRSFGEKIETIGDVCVPQRTEGSHWVSECTFGDKDSSEVVILIGDSHAQAISYSLDQVFRRQNIKGKVFNLDGCETVPFIRRNKNRSVENCEERFEEFTSIIKRQDAEVILASRWSFKLFPIEGVIDKMPYRNSEGFSERDANYREYDVLVSGEFYRDAKTKREYLIKYIEEMAKVARSLYLVYPVPETGIDIEKMNRFYYSENNQVLEQVTFPYEDFYSRNKFVIDAFDSIPAPGIKRVVVSALFCNNYVQGRCVVQRNSVPFYYDDDHLSKKGADIVVDEIFRLSDW